MNTIDEAFKKQQRLTQFLAIIFFVVAPAIYLNIAMKVQPDSSHQYPEMMPYILGIFAFIEPIIGFFLKPIFIKGFKKQLGPTNNIAKLYLTFSIIRFAFVGSVFIFGFICVLFVKDLNVIYYFYVYGVIWAIIMWPRRSHLENFVNSMERP